MIKTALYTVTYSGAFYKGPALSLEEIFPKVADMGFDALSIGAKRPVGSPLDLNPERRETIRQLGRKANLPVACIESYSNLAGPVREHREAEQALLLEIIRLAHDLEAPIVKVFAAWPGVTYRDGQATYEMAATYGWHDVTSLEQWHWVRDALTEAVGWAQSYGVTLALQNHQPVTNSYRDVLDMIDEVGSPALKACIDAPHLADQSDEGIRQAIQETGDRQVWSHFGGYEETSDGRVWASAGNRELAVNYPAFFRSLQEIGYEGHVAYEGCGPVLVGHEFQGVEEADRRARLALAYMQRLIHSADAAA